MSKAGGAATCLVVVELGTSCPAFVTEMRAECVLQEQAADERPLAFAHRVEQQLAGIGHSTRIALAVVMCADQTDGEGSRARIALAVASALAASGSGELLLMAMPEASDGLRQELFDLAETLCERVAGTEVGVRVRFSELQSGVTSERPLGPNPRASNGS